jgi:CRISPR-associated protein Csm1
MAIEGLNYDELKFITFAAFMHDIGKFVERAEDYKSEFPKGKNDYKYTHAWYTHKFLREIFGDTEEFNNYKGVNIADLAGYHHNPESIEDWIIAEADRQASGHERHIKETTDSSVSILNKHKLPLYPIVERVSRKVYNGKNISYIEKDNIESFLNLVELDTNEIKLLFPDNGVPNLDYLSYYSKFKSDISDLSFFVKKLGFTNYISTFNNLLKKYLWCVPQSAKYQELPDVSLYDHMRLTAMLASNLYIYHSVNDSYDIDSVCDRNINKYLLVGGDISGIQNFIYDINSKGAMKSIKGRSFFMQFLPTIISKKILESLGLDETHLIYSTGGHFYMILPNLLEVKNKLKEEIDKVNDYLFNNFDTEIFLRADYEEFAPSLLDSKEDNHNFCFLWDSLQRKLAFKDRTKYKNLLKTNYEKFFYFENISKSKLSFDEMGKKLRDSKYLFLYKGVDKGEYEALGYSFSFCTDKELSKNITNELTDIYCLNGKLESKLFENYFNYNIHLFPIGGLHKFEAELETIADRSMGTKWLGILRMDVDNLGMIFAEGLRNYTNVDRYKRKDFKDIGGLKKFNFYSIGRLTTLSTQLTVFFSYILNNIVESNEKWKGNSVIVYSGGDDVFVLGRWDIIPEIAIEINKKFKKFVCNNPAFSLSGGIALIKGKSPVYKGAELAGEAEENAKSFLRKYNDQVIEKNSINFMGKSYDWVEFEEILSMVNEIGEIKDNKSLISRINLISYTHKKGLYELIRLKKRKRINQEDILKISQADKWRWRMAYSFGRMQKDPTLDKLGVKLQKYFLSELNFKLKTEDGNFYSKLGIENADIVGIWASNLYRNI